MFEAGVNEIHHADQIHVYGVGERSVRKSPRHRTDARVRHYHVKMAELCDCFIDH